MSFMITKKLKTSLSSTSGTSLDGPALEPSWIRSEKQFTLTACQFVCGKLLAKMRVYAPFVSTLS